MATLDYKNLLNKTITTANYRGTNEYPMGNRGNTYARFSREDDGSYKIYYHHEHDHVPITKETYLALKNVNGVTVWGKEEDSISWLKSDYTKVDKVRRHVVTVRPDNTIEFVASSLDQGLRMKLTDWSRGIVYQNNRLGGVVYSDRWNTSLATVTVPLFRGLIVDAETMMPKQNVQVFRRKINRKLAKEIMKPYGDMLKIAETMIGNMPVTNLFSLAKEVFHEHATPLENWGDGTTLNLSHNEAYDLADKMRYEGHLLDSALLYMMGAGILNTWNVKEYDSSKRNWWMKDESSYYSNSLVRMLPKLMYRRDKPFYEEEIKVGEGYKPSVWGIKVLCDGVEVNQY